MVLGQQITFCGRDGARTVTFAFIFSTSLHHAAPRSAVLGEAEGGMPADDTRVLNGSYVRRVLEGTKGPLVSRWGSVMLRRAEKVALGETADFEATRHRHQP